jgi:hypothetical protein
MTTMTYTISVTNQTSAQGNFCLFQETKDEENMPIAWQVFNTGPFGTLKSQWSTEYSYVMGAAGENLLTGTVFKPTQSIKADFNLGNLITLTQESGTPTFKDLREKIYDSRLTVQCDSTVKQFQTAVGIGFSNLPIFISRANADSYCNFYLSSKFKIGFGNFTQGEVLDSNLFYHDAVIEFPIHKFSCEVILTAEGTWSVQYA